MRHFILTLFIILTVSYGYKAQESLSGHLNTGLIIPFTDFTESSFRGTKPNVLISAGLGYQFNVPNLRLRGDITAATIDGDDNVFFHETTFYEGLLSLQYNIVPLFSDSKFKLYLTGGAGGVFYYSKLYDIKTRSLVAESPNPAEQSLSFNPVLAGGIEMGYPISDNLEINLGFTERAVLFNDYIDAYKSGDFNDLYGSLTAGLTFYLKDKKDKSKVELDRSKYNQLISTIDSLEGASNNGNPEDIAKLEMEKREKDLRIQMLENELDSMRAKVVKLDTEKRNMPQAPDAEQLLSRPQYRLIVASLPSRAMAQRWMDRSSLDKSEMIIIYVEDINTYRVIYKSYDSYSAARKEQQQIKSVVSDAWIKKF
ncbi:MAG: SPOR domain-containing protein [Owenweeksia sp.]